MITQTYTLSLQPGGVPIRVPCVQGDALSRTLQFQLTSSGAAAKLPAGAGVTLDGTKPDGKAFTVSGTLSDSTASVTLTEQMTVLQGEIPCQLTVISGTEVLGTARFFLCVQPSAISDDPDLSATDLSAIADLRDTVIAAKAAAEASASEASASASSASASANAATTTLASAANERFDGKFLQIAYSYVDGGGATNSREHYRHCAQNDYDAIKTDLRLTSDNQLVCCHDAGLTFNDSGYIVSYDSTNNTVIHDITKSQFLGYTFNTQYSGEHCQTCDLETYLNICKTYGKIAYINIRGEYISETVTALIAALKNASFGMENVIINSFTKDALTAVRAAEPKLYLSLVIDPFTESERTTALSYAQETGMCQICLYYSNGSHTLAEMTADSSISGWISDCIAAGIRLVGAQANDAGDADTLISIGAVGVQTRVSRLNDALALNIADLEIATTSSDSSTTLTFEDGNGNKKTAEIPKLSPTDDQVKAGVSSWMDENAKPKTIWSKNVYNPDDAVTGYIASGGQINTSDAYWTTGFIPVSPGDVLTISKSGALLNAYYQAAYDSSKALVSRLTGNASSYTVPDGAAYARFTIKSSTATTDPVMICINNTDLTYEAYGSHVEAGLGVISGVWTPVVDGAASYSVQIGRYAQMGDMAIVSFAVYGTFAGSTTARIKISGCPLTSADHQFGGGGNLSGYTAAANIVFSGWKAHTNGNIYAVGQDAAATGADKWESEAIYQKSSGDFSCGGTIAFKVAE